MVEFSTSKIDCAKIPGNYESIKHCLCAEMNTMGFEACVFYGCHSSDGDGPPWLLNANGDNHDRTTTDNTIV
jgi:hypothetical protein